MQIHERIKDVIRTHKKDIQTIQWAIISGITSYVYTHYVRSIRQQSAPIRIVLVPEIRTVQDLLNPEGYFMDRLSNNIIDMMINKDLFQRYKHAPELALFNEENVEVLKTIFDLYMIPYISRRIPESISKKFDLENPEQQVMQEDRDIDPFSDKPYDIALNFIARQSVLHLLMLTPSIDKTIEVPEDNMNIRMSSTDILGITHNSALCTIYMDSAIIESSIFHVLSFVTSIEKQKLYDSKAEACAMKGNDILLYNIKTNPFNQATLTRLGDVKYHQ